MVGVLVYGGEWESFHENTTAIEYYSFKGEGDPFSYAQEGPAGMNAEERLSGTADT